MSPASFEYFQEHLGSESLVLKIDGLHRGEGVTVVRTPEEWATLLVQISAWEIPLDKVIVQKNLLDGRESFVLFGSVQGQEVYLTEQTPYCIRISCVGNQAVTAHLSIFPELCRGSKGPYFRVDLFLDESSRDGTPVTSAHQGLLEKIEQYYNLPGLLVPQEVLELALHATSYAKDGIIKGVDIMSIGNSPEYAVLEVNYFPGRGTYGYQPPHIRVGNPPINTLLSRAQELIIPPLTSQFLSRIS